jgi:hypothetical protein
MTNYTLNFAPIELQGSTEVLIGRQSYSAERLRELRSEFYRTHIFQRFSADNVIIDIPIASEAAPLGNVQERVDLKKLQGIWSQLLSAALLRAFEGQREIISSWPVSVLGSVSRGLIQHAKLPNWLQKRTVLEFDTRSIYLGGNKRLLGMVCETRIRNIINGTCADLIELGIPLIDRYVQIECMQDDKRLIPRRKLVGRVTAIDRDRLILENHADGYESVSAADVFLEARREIFDDCVQRILGREATGVLARAETKASTAHSGPSRKEQIEEAMRYLSDRASLEAVPGVAIVFGKLLSSEQENLFPATEIIPRPFLVFDPSGTRKDDWNERGIKKNGPYDQRHSARKN